MVFSLGLFINALFVHFDSYAFDGQEEGYLERSFVAYGWPSLSRLCWERELILRIIISLLRRVNKIPDIDSHYFLVSTSCTVRLCVTYDTPFTCMFRRK